MTDRELVADAVIERLTVLGQKRFSTETPKDLILGNAASPVRFFVKSEPHSQSKFKTKRWRLISNIDLVDLLIEKLLFDVQNKTEIANWMDVPSAPGIDLSSDRALQNFGGRILRLSNNLENAASGDVEGFDWSVKEWELQLDASVRARLMGCISGSWLDNVIYNRVYCLCRPLYVLPDGKLVVQREPGVQKSGSNNTSSTNSRIRVALALLIGAKWAVAMGDDCLEDFVKDAKEKYKSYGHPLKMYEKSVDTFTFCSMLFDVGNHLIHPEDGTKTLFRMLEQSGDEEITMHREQFARELRNHPRLSEFLAIVDEVFSPEISAE